MSDAAIMNVVTGMVTIATLVIGFLTLWIKLKYGVEKTEKIDQKLDDNTNVTKKFGAAAETNAREATNAAINAANKADALAEQLNGRLDERLREAIKQANYVSADRFNELAEKVELILTRQMIVLDKLGIDHSVKFVSK